MSALGEEARSGEDECDSWPMLGVYLVFKNHPCETGASSQQAPTFLSPQQQPPQLQQPPVWSPSPSTGTFPHNFQILGSGPVLTPGPRRQFKRMGADKNSWVETDLSSPEEPTPLETKKSRFPPIFGTRHPHLNFLPVKCCECSICSYKCGPTRYHKCN